MSVIEHSRQLTPQMDTGVSAKWTDAVADELRGWGQLEEEVHSVLLTAYGSLLTAVSAAALSVE